MKNLISGSINFHNSDLIPTHIQESFISYNSAWYQQYYYGDYEAERLIPHTSEYIKSNCTPIELINSQVQERWDKLVAEYCEGSILKKIDELNKRLDDYKKLKS